MVGCPSHQSSDIIVGLLSTSVVWHPSKQMMVDGDGRLVGRWMVDVVGWKVISSFSSRHVMSSVQLIDEISGKLVDQPSMLWLDGWNDGWNGGWWKVRWNVLLLGGLVVGWLEEGRSGQKVCFVLVGWMVNLFGRCRCRRGWWRFVGWWWSY